MFRRHQWLCCPWPWQQQSRIYQWVRMMVHLAQQLLWEYFLYHLDVGAGPVDARENRWEHTTEVPWRKSIETKQQQQRQQQHAVFVERTESARVGKKQMACLLDSFCFLHPTTIEGKRWKWRWRAWSLWYHLLLLVHDWCKTPQNQQKCVVKRGELLLNTFVLFHIAEKVLSFSSLSPAFVFCLILLSFLEIAK
jgi:hypothetical protein